MAPCRWPFPLKPVYNGGKSFIRGLGSIPEGGKKGPGALDNVRREARKSLSLRG